MIFVEAATFVEGITAQEIFDFLLGATDESCTYTPWSDARIISATFSTWTITSRANEGPRGRGREGKRIVWQLQRRGVLLPVRLMLGLRDHEGGVALRHTIRAGFGGPGRVLNPLFRVYFSPGDHTESTEIG